MEPWVGTSLVKFNTIFWSSLCSRRRCVQKWDCLAQISKKCSKISLNFSSLIQYLSLSYLIWIRFWLSFATCTLVTSNILFPHLLCFDVRTFTMCPFFKLYSSSLNILFFEPFSLMIRTPLISFRTGSRRYGSPILFKPFSTADFRADLKLCYLFSRKRVH